MTVYDTILLIAALQGVLLSVALFTAKKSRKKANVFLGIFILNFSLDLLDAWAGGIKLYLTHPWYSYTYFFSYLLLPPSFYLYVKHLTEPQFTFQKKHLVFFIPSLMEVLVFVGIFLDGAFFNDAYISNQFIWLFFNIVELLTVVYAAAVLGYVWKSLTEYQSSIRAYYSDIALLSYNWLKNLLTGIIIIFTIWVITLALDFFISDNPFPFSYYYPLWITISVMIYLIGYKGYTQPELFLYVSADPLLNQTQSTYTQASEHKQTVTQLTLHTLDEEPIADSLNYGSLVDADYAENAQLLLQVMEEKKLYRQPKLTLADVASELHLPKRYLSNLLNQYLHKNFYRFVNEYRVEEVKRRINDPAFTHLTILAIGLEAGFNSKASFNAVFKELTNLKPSEYKSQVAVPRR